MARRVLINLPVKDLGNSISFFENLGYQFDEQITDKLGACLILSDDVFVMLLTNEYFRTFTHRDIGNTEVIVTVYADSKKAIQDIISKANAMGATIHSPPQDYGWMYQHGLIDLDGHQWEFIFIDNNLVPDPA